MKLTTPLKSNSIKIMLLGSGELGKEVAIEANRLGCEVIAVDRYPNAPAMLVAGRNYVINMKNKDEVLDVIRREKPNFVLPEIEAINIEALFEAENEGIHIIPNAEAVNKTMNRKNIRKFAAETLGLKTSKYKFVTNYEDLKKACEELGYPAVVKPVMSSSGHGQSIVKSSEEIITAWEFAKSDARGSADELIVEEFIDFDYEITLLTAKNDEEIVFCPPIGHIQKGGDYIFSWQEMRMNETALNKAQYIAKTIVEGLGGRGIFGVEMFVKGDEVYFSEVSPRPHDTGLVTMITQTQSEFALHIRAVLNLPLGFEFLTQGASAAYKADKTSYTPVFNFDKEIFSTNSRFIVFGKPYSHPGRRMGVILVSDKNYKDALKKAELLISKISID
ncbi:formate-dependent phosphoribosylglycinamide formyltransferase [Lebetimonas sp. JH292]|uniref:formate-dependent phosphoribosylglycinamide formyltransferase n=1 Tax=Lebetimonas sp. JH292 TaxID=990068 RepID=UPI00046342FE|nr:formate-dependent phosphoribosylglycinamide formyltransferase [Lebetimonas sp. JH292]